VARRRIGQLLLVVGLACLVAGAWSGAQYRAATARRVFFVDPFGIAVGTEGHIYVGIDRREVYAYSPDGEPLSAWTVAQDAGRFRIRVVPAAEVGAGRQGGSAAAPSKGAEAAAPDAARPPGDRAGGAAGGAPALPPGWSAGEPPDERVEVALEEPGEVRVYAPTGKLLSRRADEAAFERFGRPREGTVEGPDGSVYALTDVGLMRTAPGPTRVVVPAPPAPLFWLGSRPVKPIAALLVAGTFGLIVGVVLTAMPPPGPPPLAKP